MRFLLEESWAERWKIAWWQTPALKVNASRMGPGGLLLIHFFRRFSDNDTLDVEGDTVTTIARALAIVAAPGFMVAFLLVNQYPARSFWGRVQDQYLFVLLSFVVMGAVTIFEWEMLFPDRIDFLVLTPLPVTRWQMMSAKALALVGFLLLFLVGTNLLSGIVYPMTARGPLVRQVLSQAAAVTLAGAFAACVVLVTVGLLRCLLPDRMFRRTTVVMQVVLTAATVLLLIQYLFYAQSLHVMMANDVAAVRWLPPVWFVAVYDRLLYGAEAPAFAMRLAPVGWWACAAGFGVLVMLYPLTWARMHRMAAEGALGRAGSRGGVLRALAHAVVRRPAERAMLHFLGQTILRSPRYGVYLAMYAGTGIALACACGFTLRASGAGVRVQASVYGLHAVAPLLIFWVAAGLRTAFSFPVALPARWVFRVSGVDTLDLVMAGWIWTIAAVGLVWGVAMSALAGVGWTVHAGVVQTVYGVALTIVLTDAFAVGRHVPLIEPRMPGRSNFALFLTLYIGVLMPAIFGVIWAELRMERSLRLLLPVLIAVAGFHMAFRSLLRKPMEQEEEMEGYEGAVQLLNLN